MLQILTRMDMNLLRKSQILFSSPGATVAHNGATVAHNGATVAHNGVTVAHNGVRLAHNGATKAPEPSRSCRSVLKIRITFMRVKMA